MQKTVITLITSLTLALGLYGTIVTRVVYAMDGHTLPGATVKLVDLSDSADRKFTVPDIEGRFRF